MIITETSTRRMPENDYITRFREWPTSPRSALETVHKHWDGDVMLMRADLRRPTERLAATVLLQRLGIIPGMEIPYHGVKTSKNKCFTSLFHGPVEAERGPVVLRSRKIFLPQEGASNSEATIQLFAASSIGSFIKELDDALKIAEKYPNCRTFEDAKGRQQVEFYNIETLSNLREDVAKIAMAGASR